MSTYKVHPGPIAIDTFHTYRKNWDAIIAEPSTKLTPCFTSAGSDVLMNYVFLPIDYANSLINAPDATQIQAVFVAAPPTPSPSGSPISEGAQFFSLVLIPLDVNNEPIPSSTYYLAGVADLPAGLGPAPTLWADTSITDSEAYAWTENWEKLKLGPLTLDLFAAKGDPKHRTLRGYTYDKQDFIDAIKDAKTADALWFNFALYSEPLNSISITPKPFAIALCLNKMPIPGTAGEIDFTSSQHYFDLSRPCPPCCYSTIPSPQA